MSVKTELIVPDKFLFEEDSISSLADKESEDISKKELKKSKKGRDKRSKGKKSPGKTPRQVFASISGSHIIIARHAVTWKETPVNKPSIIFLSKSPYANVNVNPSNGSQPKLIKYEKLGDIQEAENVDSDNYKTQRYVYNYVEKSHSKLKNVTSLGQDFSHLRRPPPAITPIIETRPNIQKEVEVFIDGPYGAPSSNIFQAEHAVLISTGIGVTPSASILQSIVYRYYHAKQKCPKCDHHWTSDVPTSVMNLKKVDFFWINHGQSSFEWFQHLLTQLEMEMNEYGGAMERFLDIHMYMTSAHKKNDMKAVILQLAMEKLHRKDKKDLITGLHTRTQLGRPDWNVIFRELDKVKRGKITVFFCGPDSLSIAIQKKCEELNYQFKKENF